MGDVATIPLFCKTGNQGVRLGLLALFFGTDFTDFTDFGLNREDAKVFLVFPDRGETLQYFNNVGRFVRLFDTAPPLGLHGPEWFNALSLLLFYWGCLLLD